MIFLASSFTWCMSMMRQRSSQAYMVYEYNSQTFILLRHYLSLLLTCLYDTAGVR